MNELVNHEDSWPFLEPVDLAEVSCGLEFLSVVCVVVVCLYTGALSFFFACVRFRLSWRQALFETLLIEVTLGCVVLFLFLFPPGRLNTPTRNGEAIT